MKTRRIENNLSSFVKDLILHIKTNSFIILYVHYTINLFFLKAVLMKGFRKLFTNDKKYYRKNLVLVVIKSDISDFIRGNFETKAQSLAIKLAERVC